MTFPRILAILVLLATPPACGASTGIRIARFETGGVMSPIAPVVECALHRVGITFSYVDLPKARALLEVNNGTRVDADLGRTKAAAALFANITVVDTPVYEIQIAGFIRDGGQPLTGWESLRMREVLVTPGSPLIEQLLAANGVGNVTRVESYSAMAKMLVLDRGDVALMPLREGQAMLDRMGITHVHPSGPALVEQPLYFLLNRRLEAEQGKILDAIRACREPTLTPRTAPQNP